MSAPTATTRRHRARAVPAPARIRRRTTWRQDPAGRRQRILDAATAEFARRGFRNTRMEAVAAAADVAEGTVFQQFGSKQGLLIAVGERYGRGLVAAAFGGLERPLTPADIGTVVANIFTYVAGTDGPLAAFLLANDPLEGGPAEDANRSQMVAAIEAQLRDWMARGEIAPVDARVAAELQFGLVESALRDCFLRHGGRSRDAYLGETTRMLAAALGPPPAG